MKTKVKVILSLTLTVMLMASLTVLAAPQISSLNVSDPDSNGTYTITANINDVPVPSPGSSPGTGLGSKQVTMLVFAYPTPSATPGDKTIIGIDQASSNSDTQKGNIGDVTFTFGTDTDTPVGTYSVLVGGEDVNTAAVTTFEITPTPPPVYTVTFDAQGGVPSPQPTSVTSGSTISAPAVSMTGYSLDGWYTAANGGGTKWDFTSSTVSGPTTLYAFWKINNYTVTFDLNYPDSAPIPTSVPYNTKVTALSAPERPNYAFEAWYADKDCTTLFNFDTPITDNTTVYAMWTAVQSGPSINSATDEVAARVAFEADANIDRSVKYDPLTDDQKNAVIAKLFAAKPFADEASLQTALDGSVTVVLRGDINMDGVVDGNDCSIIYAYMSYESIDDTMNPDMDQLAFYRGDVNDDGVVDGNDCSQIYAYMSYEDSTVSDDHPYKYIVNP